MALGLNYMRYPGAGIRISPTWGDALMEQATVLNDSSPTFTRASAAYDPYNRITATSGARRRRPLAISRNQTVFADLIEGPRTNLCLQSQNLANASWVKTDSTITTGAGIAPDGTSTLDLVTEGSAGTASTVQTMTITAGRAVAAAAVLIRGNHDWVLLRFVSGSDFITAWFNLATGTKGSLQVAGAASAQQYDMEALSGGRYRCVISGILSGTDTAIDFRVFSASADTSTTRVAGGTRMQGWHSLEMSGAGATAFFPSSYIATTTVAVSRAADTLSVPYVLGQTGTILALCVPYGWNGDQDGTSNYVVWHCDDTNNSRAQRANATALTCVRADSGAARFSNVVHGYANNALAQIGLSWDSTAVRGYANGVAATPGTTLTPPYNTNTVLKIGHNQAAGFPFHGWLSILTWPRALAAPELLALDSALPVAA